MIFPGVARLYLGLAVFVIVVWLAVLSARPLFNPDEGRYAEIPREMVAGGDYVVPHLDGLAYVEKPPLQYWATSVSFRLLGLNAFAARFYTALTALATLLVIGFTANRLFGTPAGWRASAMLSGMLLFVVLGQLLTLDTSLSFYMSSSLACFLLAQRAAARAAERSFMMAAWAAVGLGVLTKGLVAALVPAATLMLYSTATRDFRPWRRLHALPGLAIFLVIAVPWFYLVARRLPDFLQFFFVHEHFARFLTPSADREQPWWFFGAVFLAGTVPWTFPALRALGCGWRRTGGRAHSPGEFNTRLFLWLWVVFVCVFFSLSDSKLIPYILPAMPALALLMADSLEERDLPNTALLTVTAALLLALLCVFAPRYLDASARHGYFLALQRPLAEVAVLLGSSGLAVIAQRRGEATRSTVLLGAGWGLAGLLLMRAAAAVAPLYSGIEIARAQPRLPPDAPVYSVGTYDQTLPFYWGRTVVLVAYRGELDFGLRRDATAEIPSVAEFVDRWNRDPAAYAVMELSMFEDLKTQGVPMHELTRDPRRILVSRR